MKTDEIDVGMGSATRSTWRPAAVCGGCLLLGLAAAASAVAATQFDYALGYPGALDAPFSAVAQHLAREAPLVLWNALLFSTVLIPVMWLSLREKRVPWLVLTAVPLLCFVAGRQLHLPECAFAPALLALFSGAGLLAIVITPNRTPALTTDRCNRCDYPLVRPDTASPCSECGVRPDAVARPPVRLRWHRTIATQLRAWLLGTIASAVVLGAWYAALLLYGTTRGF